jgi:hypothetical protein
VVVAAPPVDLSPVADPQGLFASGRIAKLSASFDVVHAWSKLPMPGAEQVTELLTSEAVGPLVDLDQPVDFAVTVSGKFPKIDILAAVSAAMKEPEKAKASLADRYKLVPAANGAVMIQGLGRPSHNDSDQDDDDKPDRKTLGDPERSCEIAPAFGSAPTRLVCAWSPKALTELAPWLTRTATRAAPSSQADAHADVRMEPIRGLIAAGMQIPRGLLGLLDSTAWTAPLQSALDDLPRFADDLGGLALDVRLNDPGASATLTLKLQKTTSETARLVTAHPERNGPPPAVFWQLPGDADEAVFSRGIDDADVASVTSIVQQIIESALRNSGAKDADIKDVVGATAKLWSGAPAAYASGVDADGLRRALAALGPLAGRPDDATTLEAKHVATQAILGWHVTERDEPATRAISALKDMTGAIGRPGLFATWHKKNPDRPAPVAIRSAPLPRGATLPAGSVHYVVEIFVAGDSMPMAPPAPGDKAKKPPPRPKPLAVHVLLVPDGQRSWLGLGGDDALCAARVAASMGNTGATLGSRSDLGSIKQNTSVGGAGFLTLRGIAETAAIGSMLDGESPSEVASVYEDSLALPHQALTPLPFSLTPGAGQAGSPGPVVATFAIPKGSIEDFVTMVVKHGGF